MLILLHLLFQSVICKHFVNLICIVFLQRLQNLISDYDKFDELMNYTLLRYTRRGPKVTGLFQYLKMRMKYKFF